MHDDNRPSDPERLCEQADAIMKRMDAGEHVSPAEIEICERAYGFLDRLREYAEGVIRQKERPN